jgi:hypothetical protein
MEIAGSFCSFCSFSFRWQLNLPSAGVRVCFRRIYDRDRAAPYKHMLYAGQVADTACTIGTCHSKCCLYSPFLEQTPYICCSEQGRNEAARWVSFQFCISRPLASTTMPHLSSTHSPKKVRIQTALASAATTPSNAINDISHNWSFSEQLLHINPATNSLRRLAKQSLLPRGLQRCCFPCCACILFFS